MVGPEKEAGVAHELVAAGGGAEEDAVVVAVPEGVPFQAVVAPSEMEAVVLADEVGEEVAHMGLGRGGENWCDAGEQRPGDDRKSELRGQG